MEKRKRKNTLCYFFPNHRLPNSCPGFSVPNNIFSLLMILQRTSGGVYKLQWMGFCLFLKLLLKRVQKNKNKELNKGH